MRLRRRKKTKQTPSPVSTSATTMVTESSSSTSRASDPAETSSPVASHPEDMPSSAGEKHVQFLMNSISRFRSSFVGHNKEKDGVDSPRKDSVDKELVVKMRSSLKSLYSELLAVEWSKYALPSWRAVFAILAIADMATCWPVLMQGWDPSEQERPAQSHVRERRFHFLHHNKTIHDDNGSVSSTCSANDLDIYYQQYGSLVKKAIGVIFCIFCLAEAGVRAREAQSAAIESAALDNFEKRLTRAYSSTRMSFVGSFRMQGSIRVDPRGNINPSQLDEILARSTVRTWLPVILVMSFWLALLPLNSPRDYTCGEDQAWATVWMAVFFTQLTAFAELMQDKIFSVVWRIVMPYSFLQPHRLFNRVRHLLRMVRYVRFAGPLARMMLKLGDQIVSLFSTWRQRLVARMEKAKRRSRPSILFTDIKRIESLAKVQTALARLPSQIIHLAQDKMNLPFGKGNGTLEEKREQGQKWRDEIDELKLDLRHRRSFNESVSDLYDRIVHLTEDLQSNLNNTVLSSPQHLISPHSRFGLLWRITVTNCFILEITRLSMSWQLSGTFKTSLRSIMSKMLVECDPSHVKKKFSLKVLHNVAHGIHRHLSNVFPLLPRPEKHFTVCMPTSTTSILFLELGRALETFIDVVGFLDIFIWFFTGELDSNGLVVPKQFFYRCILPGTLSQILDHPTLPDILPALITRFMGAVGAVGVSRALRWVLAIVPACIMLVINPLESFFIGTVDSDEGGMIHYAESCGVLAPRSPSISANMNGGTLNPRTNSTGNQVGLSLSTRVDSSEFQDDKDDDDILKKNVDLPSPRPLWSRKTVEVDLDANDDSYSFDYAVFQY